MKKGARDSNEETASSLAGKLLLLLRALQSLDRIDPADGHAVNVFKVVSAGGLSVPDSKTTIETESSETVQRASNGNREEYYVAYRVNKESFHILKLRKQILGPRDLPLAHFVHRVDVQ